MRSTGPWLSLRPVSAQSGVVEQVDGAWMGIEVKLGTLRAGEPAAALRAVADHRVERPPEALTA